LAFLHYASCVAVGFLYGCTREQTLQPSGSAGKNAELAEQPVDQTIPPSSAASLEMNAEVAHDQTVQTGSAHGDGHDLACEHNPQKML